MPQAKYGYPNDFLKKIEQIESSGGTNTQHPMLQHGIQAGTAAIGRYGLMPNTVREIVNRRRQDGTMTQDLQDLDQIPPERIKAHIEANPGLEDDLARTLATHVLRRQLGDEDKAAYSWHQGHNLDPSEITHGQLNDPSSVGGDYVNKFRRVKDMFKPEDEEDDQ